MPVLNITTYCPGLDHCTSEDLVLLWCCSCTVVVVLLLLSGNLVKNIEKKVLADIK